MRRSELSNSMIVRFDGTVARGCFSTGRATAARGFISVRGPEANYPNGAATAGSGFFSREMNSTLQVQNGKTEMATDEHR